MNSSIKSKIKEKSIRNEYTLSKMAIGSVEPPLSMSENLSWYRIDSSANFTLSQETLVARVPEKL